MTYVPGKGTTISVTTGSTTLSEIGQVVNITPPALARGEVECTHLGSSWREFIPTIADGGEATFTIEWDPALATHVDVLNSFTTGDTRSWRIGFKDTGTAQIDFAGFITAFPIDEVTVDSVNTISITIRTTSAVTIST